MNGNEFEYKGVTYVTVCSSAPCNCSHCAFINVDNCDASGIPPCSITNGRVTNYVIFVEKQND